MKKQKLPSIVIIAVLTVITVVFWIGLDVYRAFTIKPVAPVAQEILNPLDPTLDDTKLSELQKRVYIDSVNLSQTTIVNPEEEIVATQEPSPSPESSQSAQTVQPSPTP